MASQVPATRASLAQDLVELAKPRILMMVLVAMPMTGAPVLARCVIVRHVLVVVRVMRMGGVGMWSIMVGMRTMFVDNGQLDIARGRSCCVPVAGVLVAMPTLEELESDQCVSSPTAHEHRVLALAHGGRWTRHYGYWMDDRNLLE